VGVSYKLPKTSEQLGKAGKGWRKVGCCFFFVVLEFEPRVLYCLSHTPSSFVFILLLRQGLANFAQAGFELEILSLLSK
jgi:hypothetical protein